MPPLFVTPPFSPWRPGDAFNQEKEVKYKRKRGRKKTKSKNKEVKKPVRMYCTATCKSWADTALSTPG